ncbi:hypothetical protein SAMN05216268_13535 [Streptomyces yunnanensis]|uniref:Uncharacterized protein n=1 Tax=Streptomyces yunnanensis TaxID=156453 RepID=A0A9X8N977_9ACTN|nr:hypothetical protein SAMN05216268_13535 [Streptomyces yunnanensis]
MSTTRRPVRRTITVESMSIAISPIGAPLGATAVLTVERVIRPARRVSSHPITRLA